LLRVKNLNTFYADAQVLRNVSLEINEGEIVSIVGSNAAGKSTLINTLSGIIHAKSGSIEFLGKNIEKLFPHQIVKMGLIQVPEGRRLFPGMTVLENLRLGMYLIKDKEKEVKNLEEVFRLFPILKIRKSQIAQTLSGGEQQMLAIARALVGNPKLLIFDEPSLGLAPKLVVQVFNIIKLINDQGLTVLLIEQNIFQALNLCDRCYVIENGRIVMEGKGKELLNLSEIKKAYLGI